MTYPIPNYTRVWVFGSIIDLPKAVTGDLNYGAVTPVTFVPSPKVLVNQGTGQIIATGPFRVTPSATTGYFQVLLPATDDPDVNPTNFTYRVVEGSTGRQYDIVVPEHADILDRPGHPLHGERAVDLSRIAPAPGPSGGLVQLVSGRGIASLDVVDADLVVTYSDDTTHIVGPLPEGGGGSTPDATQSTKGKAVLLGGTADNPTVPWSSVTDRPSTLPPSGSAGGVLSGTFPSPGFAQDMATQAELDTGLAGKAQASVVDAHLANTTNPHAVTKTQVGLANVDNTSDVAKPVSTATQAAITTAAGSRAKLGASAGTPIRPWSWTPRLRDSFDTGWSNYYSNDGVSSFDTEVVAEPGQSVKLVSNTAGNPVGMRKSVNRSFADEHFVIKFRSDDWTKVNTVRLQFWSNAGGTNTYIIDLASRVVRKPANEWIELAFGPDTFTTTGTPDLAQVTHLVVDAVGIAGQSCTVWFDAFMAYERPRRGAISLSFDDSWLDTYTKCYPKMQSLGIRGTVYAIPSQIGIANRMTEAMHDELHRAGWEIAGHGPSSLNTDTLAAREADVAATRAWLDARNYRGRDTYAYPEGQNDDAIRAIVGKYFTYGRTVDYPPQPLTYINPMRINSVAPGASTTLQGMMNRVDQAIANKTWLNICFHTIPDGTAQTIIDFSKENFDALIDYIAAKADVDVLPIAETLAVQHAPASRTPATSTASYNAYDAVSSEVVVVEDFLNGTQGSPFAQSVSGTGASISTLAPYSLTQQGVARLTTGTTATGVAAVVIGPNTLIFGAGPFKLKSRFRLPTLSASGTEEYKARFGMIDASQYNAVTDGAWFEYDPAVSPNWLIKTSSGSTVTSTTTSVAVDTADHTFEIVCTPASGAGTAVFNFDGATIGTITTNVPYNAATASSPALGIGKTVGTTARNLDVDYIAFRQTVSR